MIARGIVIVGIDLDEGMPGWWIAVESPCGSGFGGELTGIVANKSKKTPENSCFDF
jgi:hypothetical protein